MNIFFFFLLIQLLNSLRYKPFKYAQLPNFLKKTEYLLIKYKLLYIMVLLNLKIVISTIPISKDGVPNETKINSKNDNFT